MKSQAVRTDRNVKLIIKIAGYSSILFVTIIFVFLLREGLPALGKVKLSNLFSVTWYPSEDFFWDFAIDWRIHLGHDRSNLGGTAARVGYRDLYFGDCPKFDQEHFETINRDLGGAALSCFGIHWNPGACSGISADFQSGDRIDSLYRCSAAWIDRNSNHCFNFRRCIACRAAIIPGRGTCTWRNSMANHLGGNGTCCEIRHPDSGHAGGGTCAG